MSAPTAADRAEIARLRDPRTIRACAERMLDLAQEGALPHFALDLGKLPAVAERVVALIRRRYADPSAIPYHSRWRHFETGGVDRAAAFAHRLEVADLDPQERLRARVDLAVTSVLLDAGAGGAWSYREADTGVVCGRSEGLALASYHWFASGGFSSDPRHPLRADADGLARVSVEATAQAFQVSADNPLLGVAGRAELLRRLGATLRGGHLLDALPTAYGSELPAAALLAAVLERLGPIWPGRHEIAGVNLGDVWPHPRLGLVPFHKLSQWLTYSLLEPLETAGVRVVDLDALTGLAEYRNGGLFVDAGVLRPRDESASARVHAVDSGFVVEWRALTVALLDRVAADARRLLHADARSLPLAKVLEGGTWLAGREIARERRPDGRPPFPIESDGTVF